MRVLVACEFSGRAGASGAPSVLCAYGHRDVDVLAFCGLDGRFVPLRLARGVVVSLSEPGTWRESLAQWLAAHHGPVSLDELYRVFAEHRRARTNPNYRAKIRQVLQLGPFHRVDRGVWEAA